MLKMSLISLFEAKYMISMLTGRVDCSETVKNRNASVSGSEASTIIETKHCFINKENFTGVVE